MQTAEEIYVTVTGFASYYGIKAFKIGRTLRLRKEPENDYDAEAIRAEIQNLGKVGYVANSMRTRANGTMSAGYIYSMFDTYCYAKIMFTTQSKVIVKIIGTDRGIKRGDYNDSDFT